MKKILSGLVLSLFLVSSVFAATGWVKTKPASSESPSDISTLQGENNAALDLMLSTYANCEISYATAATLTVSAGGIMASNTAGTVRLMLANAAATTVTWAMIDTGAEAASTTYYVYAIGSATTDTVFTVKISTSSTAPTGVTYYKRLGSFYNDASSNIIKVIDDRYSDTQELGTWVARSVTTIYQAATDGFVCAYTAIGCENKYLSGFTDVNATPTTRVAYFDLRGAYNAGRGNMNIMFPVKKGDYWQVTTDATISNIYWIPIQLSSN